MTGVVSGIVVIDCDPPGTIAWADEHPPPTGIATRTAKGEHRFYRHPGGFIKNTVRVYTGEARIEIDVRADGGYVVGPGSVHETGTVYEKVADWPAIDKLPVFDPVWLHPAATQARHPRRHGARDRA